MSKYNNSNRSDEKAVAVLTNFFSNKYGNLFDLQFHGIKDNTPDTDGFLRLREEDRNKKDQGKYLNKVVFFQLKGQKESIKNNSYRCLSTLVNFCNEINLPTILFVVGSLNEEAENRGFTEIYWYHFSNVNSEILSTKKASKHIRIPNLEPLKIGEKEFIDTFYSFIKGLAKKDSFQDLPKEALDLSVDYKDKIIIIAGLIYLLGKTKKDEIIKSTKLLKKDVTIIINDLKKKKLIYYKDNLLFFKKIEDEFKRNVGLLFLHEAITKINLFEIYDIFEDPKKRSLILQSLSQVNHPVVNNFLNELPKEFKNYFPKFENNDDIFVNLELLEKYIYKTPNQAIQILKKIINSKKPLKTVTTNIKGLGNVEGRSHDNLIEKSIELLEKLRYIKQKEVFTLLLKLSKSKNKNIKEKAIKALEMQSKYNFFVLQKVGYQPQIFLLKRIERYEKKGLLTNFESISTILKQIITPSFEGSEMTDYETLTIHRGALNVSKNLKDLRTRAIGILQKLFLLSKTLRQKKKILQILREATQTPLDNYTEDLENLILENTNKIIEFYNEIIEEADYEILKEIEGQLNDFTKRYPKKLKNIKKLQSLIAQNTEYSTFKIFVGYDYNFNKNLDWKKSEKDRKQKIQKFVNQISNDNFEEWQNKTLSIINNYNQIKDYGKYRYFNIFLNELGRQKPQIALKLIENNEDELEEFLIHLVAGIWKSKSKNIAVEFIEDSINGGKHLSLCTDIFSYVKEIDEKLLKKAFKKATQQKDVKALNNIIRSIVNNYPSDNRHTKLFIDSIKELTSLQDYLWINNVWYQKDSIVEHLSENDFDVILNNLLLVPNVDYHTEVVLKIIAKEHPLKIINFFEKRVSIQLKKKGEDRYDAIPYKFHELNSTLQDYAKVIIPEVLKWFKKKDLSINLKGGSLLKNIYSFDKLNDELVRLLNTGKEEDTKIVLSILSIYQGHITLDSKAIQTLIRKCPKYYDSVISYMSATGGVVSGEYGLVDYLKDKRKAVQKWKNDKRKYIQSFVAKYEESLNKQIDYTKMRADENIVLKKT